MNVRPEILNIDNETLIAELFTHRKIYNDEGFTDILIFPTLVLTKKEDENEKFNLPIDEEMFTMERGLSLNGYTYGVGKIVRLAEINNDHLHSFIKEYFHKNDLEAFYKRSADCAKIKDYQVEEKIEFLTYGNLKNILGLIVKTDTSFYNIEEFKDPNKRKQFRRIYENYVLDRDRFTHGKLYFLYPDFNPVLRVRGNDGKDFYITYSKEIFLSNLETFDFLEVVLSKMKQVLENKKL